MALAFVRGVSTGVGSRRVAGCRRWRSRTCRVATRMSTDGAVGFIGLGIMGLPMAQNLIREAGRELIVWNRSKERSEQLANDNDGKVTVVSSPRAVIESCSVTFSMLSTPEAVEAVYFGSGDGSALLGVSAGKHIIDCSTLTEEASQKTAAAVSEKGGKFLEAPVSGSKVPAEKGQLIFLCGGDKETFDMVQKELDVMGKRSFFLGETGAGTRMKLVVNMVMGSMVAALSEGVVLAENTGLSTETLLEVLDLGAMANPMFKLKGPQMINGKYPPHFPLEHAQKDMRFAGALGDKNDVSMPVAAAANELFIAAKAKGFARDDMCGIIEALRNKPKK
mmetsp:Transcript_6877/g.20916  ORF Transcript_6877/g.20916 Transcript_6877/m.20916 type:complete len:335 (+) Transcript_6877:195-1199(+)